MNLSDIKNISPIYFQMFAHWIYVIFSIQISPNRHGVLYLLLSYIMFSFLYLVINKINKLNFTLLSILVVLNSTYLNFQYPSEYPFTIFLVFLLAIIIKFYFRNMDNNSSLINPSIAAISIVTFIFPTLGSYSARFWSGDWYHVLTIVLIGLFVTYKASTIIISITYLITHLALAAMIDIFMKFFEISYFILRPSLAINLSLLSFGSLLYTFHVISDPQSGPRKKIEQFWFGLGIGVLDVTLKYLDVIQSAIVSYLIVTLIWIWIKNSMWKKLIH